jgi:Calcineurin-like phosphoesterase
MKFSKGVARFAKNQRFLAVLTILVISSIGVSRLLSSRAATPSFSLETSTGAVSGSARNVADGSASGGNHVRFGERSDATGITIVAAGDIACGRGCTQAQTANMIESINPEAVFALGDTAYKCGKVAEFEAYYRNTWGKPSLLAKTYPLLGNHEYRLLEDARKDVHCLTADPEVPNDTIPKDPNDPAGPYFEFFKSRFRALGVTGAERVPRKFWYKLTLGNWRIYVLDSQCQLFLNGRDLRVPSCEPGSEQYEWFKRELTQDAETNSRMCTMAMWHKPIRGIPNGHSTTNLAPALVSGDNGEYEDSEDFQGAQLEASLLAAYTTKSRYFLDLAYDNKVDVVLHGDAHAYQRFNRTNKALGLERDPTKGVVSIVAGTGGQPTSRSLLKYEDEVPTLAYPLRADVPEWSARRGVLKMTLKDQSADFAFITLPRTGETGYQTIDSGSIDCI